MPRPRPHHYQRWLTRLLAAWTAWLGLVAAANAVLDPFQILHAPWLGPARYALEDRYQLVGLARHVPCDRLLVGSSTIRNLVPSEFDRLMGGRTLRLAVAGGTLHEQRLFLEEAARANPIRAVYWALDPFALEWPSDAVRDDWGPFPAYLFERSWATAVRYALDRRTTLQSLANLAHAGDEAGAADKSIDRYCMSDEATAGPAALRRDWAEGFGAHPLTLKLPPAAVIANAEANAVATIQAHPAIAFTVYFPPISTLYFRAYWQRAPADLERLLAIKRDVALRLMRLPNVRLYDFQADPTYGLDVAHYHDMRHFSATLGSRLVHELAQPGPPLTPLTLDRGLRQLRASVLALDPDRLLAGHGAAP